MTLIDRRKMYEARVIKQNTSLVNNHASLPETIIEDRLPAKNMTSSRDICSVVSKNRTELLYYVIVIALEQISLSSGTFISNF